MVCVCEHTYSNCETQGWDEADEGQQVSMQTTQHHQDNGERKVVARGRVDGDLGGHLGSSWLVHNDHILY